MSEPISQFDRAVELIHQFARRGVDTWCIAPGGRNAPLAAALARTTAVTVFRFFEERAAAFFALGRARVTGRPVAVATTSGTAAAELLPAAIEAYYAGVPIALVTADRPHRMRGTGAPQAIEQRQLFVPYAEALDLDSGDAIDTESVRSRIAEWSTGPFHLNVAFDESPLVDIPDSSIVIEVDETTNAPIAAADRAEGRAEDRAASAKVRAFLSRCRRPLVIVGTLTPREAVAVRTFLLRFGAPVITESTSQLREDPALAPLRLEAPEKVADRALDHHGIDGILRLGGVPTIRLWRDLDRKRESVPVCSVSSVAFPGLSRGDLAVADLARLLPDLDETQLRLPSTSDALHREDRATARSVDDLLRGEPRAEPSLVRAISRCARGTIFLGNSLPIREWDAFATRDATDSHRMILANRGANGIDGQLSTAFGAASGRSTGPESQRECWIVVGDLTALYDLAAPWVLSQLDVERIRIVVINNGGGRIFDRVIGDATLRNAHAHDFRAWAEMWGLGYARWETVDSSATLADRTVVELIPDNAATERFWRGYDEIVQS